MKSTELYRILETELKPFFTPHDFKKQRASRLVLQRPAGSVFHSVWFKTDKWGWDSAAGGSFFVTFTVSASSDVEGVVRREERLNHFLTDAELISAREYQDAVVARIPKPPESYFENLLVGFGRSVSPESAASLVTTVRGYFEPEPLPFQRHQDFGLRYWEAGDVKGWATLIASVLPRAIEEMKKWSPLS